ncbi:LOW QUALITY PROTEIN: disease resistance protein RPS5-like [Typha latifolia]|uniref:LOW QUALITY PROTEIN: disease resistance protein RPS5-like n=1 Tax=Typha latifolia TaxID=4733 RepID=UPI003C2EB75F
MELLNSVADLALAPLFNFLMRQLTYPFKAGDNVRALRSASGHLLTKKDDVVEKIEIAERNGQRPTHQLQRWLDEVEATKTQVDAIVEKYKQSCLCFKCFSPDCCSNYTISKTAAKKLLDVQRLLNSETTEEVSITPVPPPVQEVPIPTTSTALPNANPNLEEALHYIKEEQVVGMIGIWGMGGVGKTCLLGQINNSFIGDSSFDVVIFYTASQSYTTRNFQKEIAKSLKLQRDGDVSTQAHIIFSFLSKRNFLLLLDDIWERIDLQEVGIPFPLGLVGGCKRKVVLTTRSTTVCGQMEVRKKIKVESLNYQDAWSLFLEKVGEETISSHPRISSLAKDVVKELRGLPLALITTGRAMYEKKDPREWEHAIDLLKKSQLDKVEKHSPEDIEKGTFYRLKFSYDSLNSDTLRECFLSCSMWPEDYWIKKEELIECWMGLGLIKEFDNMSEAFNTGYTLIGDLVAACLLEPDRRYGLRVRMHDVLRDMALWIARDKGKNKNKWMVFQDEAPRDKRIWHQAERITLMLSKIRELPPIASTPSSSKLTTLMLLRNRELESLGDVRAFWTSHISISPTVDLLLYLNLTDNSGIRSLPKELGSLVNLKYLILRSTGIRTIHQGVIAKLKSLQVLDLHKTWGTNSENLTYLPSLLFQDLECLDNLRGLGICVEDKSQLYRLTELSNVSVRWLVISKLEKSTSLSLSAGFLGEERIQMNLAYLRFVNSDVTQVVIEGNHQHPAWHLRALEGLRFEHMHGLEEIIWKGVVPEELFQSLLFLYIESCVMLKNISWILHLPCLRILYVSLCSNVRQLIAYGAENYGENVSDTAGREEEKEITSTSTFPCLNEIYFYDLPEMVSICHSTVNFPALSRMRVKNCPKFKKLPFRSDSIPNKLQFIESPKQWWESLEWEGSRIRSSFQPFYKEISEE